jgi:hypothetical protein
MTRISVFNLRVYSEKSAVTLLRLPFAVFGKFKELFAMPGLQRSADSRRVIARYRTIRPPRQRDD